MSSGPPSEDSAYSEALPEAAHVTESNANALMEHYERFFGARTNIVIHEIKSTGVHVDTYLYNPTEDRPFITAATIGMSALPVETAHVCENCKGHGSAPKYRSELVIYFEPTWDHGDLISRYPLAIFAHICRGVSLESYH
jgi:hypothetical protein